MWVLPTFGRPKICRRALDSITGAGCASAGIVVVDGDPDPRYRDLRLPPRWRLVVQRENRGMLTVLNGVFTAHPGEPWYGLLNDDMVVRTPGWDARMIEAAGAWGMSSSNDLWQAGQPAPSKPGGRMCGALVFGGDLLRALGWWAPPGLFHCFADDAWEAVAARFGNRRYLRDVVVEHWHAENGKAERDATYEHAYGRLEDDRRVWEGFTRDDLPAALDRVAAASGLRPVLQVPDGDGPAILSTAASATPGYVEIPEIGGTGAFSIAAVNIGSGGEVTLTADTGAAVLPLSVTICRTDPSTGACLAPPAARVATAMAAEETATFAVFVTARGSIADVPGVNRVFVTFADPAARTCGEISVAVRTRP